MNQSVQKAPTDIEKKNDGKWITFGVPAAFIIPGTIIGLQFLFGWTFGNPSITGPVGDTIGGIAGPLLNFIGLRYIYKTFKEQKEENAKVSDRFEKDKNFQQLNATLSDYKKSSSSIDYESIRKDLESLLEDISMDGSGDFHQDIGSCYKYNYQENGDVETIQIKSPEGYYKKYRESLNNRFLNKSAAFRDLDYTLDLANLLVARIGSSDLFENDRKFLIELSGLYIKKSGINIFDDLRQTMLKAVEKETLKSKVDTEYGYVDNVLLEATVFDKLRIINTYYNKIIAK